MNKIQQCDDQKKLISFSTKDDHDDDDDLNRYINQ